MILLHCSQKSLVTDLIALTALAWEIIYIDLIFFPQLNCELLEDIDELSPLYCLNVAKDISATNGSLYLWVNGLMKESCSLFLIFLTNLLKFWRPKNHGRLEHGFSEHWGSREATVALVVDWLMPLMTTEKIKSSPFPLQKPRIGLTHLQILGTLYS